MESLKKNKSKNFWLDLPKPVMVLAPMADVTDPAFRVLIAKYGKPDVTWTEFVSADGLCSAGREALLKDLAYSEEERPIVAQLFSSTPEKMEEAARLVQELGFDGLDINMGCPDRAIERQGCGAAMIKDPARAKEIIRAAKRGAPDIPVSVKTRIGYNADELETWLPALLEEKPAVITVHARTRKEMSAVPARWERVKRAVEIRNEMFGDDPERPLIFGNGDVTDIRDAKDKAAETGADGIMLGRAIFGNPWLFSKESRESKKPYTPFWHPIESGHDPISPEEIAKRLRMGAEHAHLFERLLPHKSFQIMKKHFKAYCTGWHGAKILRIKLMEAADANEIEAIVEDYLRDQAMK
jgi:nifR3 family TIM-barrel protein